MRHKEAHNPVDIRWQESERSSRANRKAETQGPGDEHEHTSEEVAPAAVVEWRYRINAALEMRLECIPLERFR